MDTNVSKYRTEVEYDCIGIGFGPSNISLAIALEERNLVTNVLFLESRDHHSWFPEMMLPGTDIQHNPLRDLVTPRNPQSKYGFLNYLKEHNRLFDFLNLDSPFPPRSDYTAYVSWVANQFEDKVKLKTNVCGISIAEHNSRLLEITDQDGAIYFARSIAFGTGRSPLIPQVFSGLIGDRIIHLNSYLSSVERWISEKPDLHIGVVGGSQSAIEIILDASARAPQAKITNVSRGFGFKQKDLSPFTEQIYLPEFVDYYFNASESSQSTMTKELWRSNYGAADHDVIQQLNFKLYEQKVMDQCPITLLHNHTIEQVAQSDSDPMITLRMCDKHAGKRRDLALDAVVLATGFRNFGSQPEQEPYHPLLEKIAGYADFREDGGISICRDFSLKTEQGKSIPPIFINGLCESTHGFGDAGSFSLLSVRAETIATSLERFCLPVNMQRRGQFYYV